MHVGYVLCSACVYISVADHMECIASHLFTADTDDISVLLLLSLLSA